ncbi:DsbA family oxidoreductase [Vogesella indigofera]|uniref:DsbA family oxidoreductase n=1 Tax=Vogesella indigofera TaxID=45465 RepID=UPI00234F112B|nr:DsbA family oxidoreductase [Vogesella indigofera]MDC7710825.1 DsbA family oxidoreductase [Vogesella indigofera]
MKRVNVEIWSDFACPWCWIAKRRLETAVLSLAGQIEVIVTSKSYRLAKGMAPVDFQEALHQKFGNAAAARRMMATVAESGAMEGLTYNFDSMRFGDTSDAHALVKSIGAPEDRQRIIERIYQAYTTDGIDIFDREALVSLAKEMGLSETSLDFDSSQIASEITRDELEANRVANGVPLFVFNNKLHFSGAQEVAVFEKALLEAAIDVPAPLDGVVGTSCSIDGCAI